MKRMISAAIVIGALAFGPLAATAAPAPSKKATTIVLVHGAFAGSSSWNPVISGLQAHGYTVIAAANPLRTVKTDADYVARIVSSIPGPVVLVGHSYGGEVISVAAYGAKNVKGLVFVAGFAPEAGESAASLGSKFPTGTLAPTLAPPIALAGGAQDLYIDQAKYWKQFAADVPKGEASQMAATQRPIAQSALGEPAGLPGWKAIPSYFIWGSADKNIPAALHSFMAKRAKGREAVEVKGASHVVMVSHPGEVTAMIERAASAK